MLKLSILRSFHGSDVELVKKRENCVLHWYPDSLGKTTGGWGHLKRKGDPAAITQDIADAWLEVDLAGARRAAQKQFARLPFQSQALYEALVSVNYQFGNDFDTDFPNTFKLLEGGYYTKAVQEIKKSLWNRQTPTRVKDFIEAIEHTVKCYNQYKEIV